MKSIELRRANRPAYGLLPLTFLLTIAAPPSFAQEQEIEEVIVTGSRIPRTGFETLQPATVLDNEKLELRGNADLAAVLNEQAGFAAPGVSPVSLRRLPIDLSLARVKMKVNFKLPTTSSATWQIKSSVRSIRS